MKHFLFKVSNGSTTLRTVIFTLGHFCIDTFVITSVTGADLLQSGRAAILGPLINAAWYWVLDRFWTLQHFESEHVQG